MISVSVLTITPVQDYLYSSPFLTHPSAMLLYTRGYNGFDLLQSYIVTRVTCITECIVTMVTECIVTMVTESCKSAFVLRDEPEIITTGIF